MRRRSIKYDPIRNVLPLCTELHSNGFLVTSFLEGMAYINEMHGHTPLGEISDNAALNTYIVEVYPNSPKCSELLKIIDKFEE